MKIKEKQQGEFIPHPETDGMVKGVIVDVTPLKTVQSQYGEREVFRLVIESEVENDEDRRFCVWSRPFTPSLNEKSNFRKELKRIMGRDLTALELKEYDTESLIGFGVNMIVQHELVPNGTTYAVISFIAPDKSGSPITASGSYKRVKDREPYDGNKQSAPAQKAPVKAISWQQTIVHVGKFKGMELGKVPEDGAMALIDHWIPTADPNCPFDAPLIKALKELAVILDPATQNLGF
jgi:hypothetical protein